MQDLDKNCRSYNEQKACNHICDISDQQSYIAKQHHCVIISITVTSYALKVLFRDCFLFFLQPISFSWISDYNKTNYLYPE